MKTLGLKKVVYLYLLINELSAYKKNQFMKVAREAIRNNDGSVLQLMFEFIYPIVFKHSYLINPSYSLLKRLSRIPIPIIRTNILMGDYETAQLTKRRKLDAVLSNDFLDTRRYMLNSLITNNVSLIDSNEFLCCNDFYSPSDYRYERIADIATRLASPDYESNWVMLDSVTGTRPWYFNSSYEWHSDKAYARDVFDLLPWVEHGLAYSRRTTAGLLNTIIPYEDRTRRLCALLAGRDVFEKLWVSACGNGYGSLKADSYIRFVRKLYKIPLIPRRLWDDAGNEYDLRSDFVFIGVPSLRIRRNKFPHEFMRYIVTGELPETISCSNYWLNDSVTYTKIDNGYNINNRTFFNNENETWLPSIMFKLRTGESNIDDLWNDWTDVLKI